MIVAAQEGHRLSEIFRDFKKFTSSQLLSNIKTHSGESRKEWMLPLFRRAAKKSSSHTKSKFWIPESHPIELHNNYLKDQKLEYIHQNPVLAGFVDEPEHFKFSSARDYAGIRGLVDIEFL